MLILRALVPLTLCIPSNGQAERIARWAARATVACIAMVQRQPSGRVRNEPTNDRRIPLSSRGWLAVADHSDRFRRRRAVRATWTARTLAHRFDDAIVAAAMAGLPVGLPARLREAAFVLLGISMGSSATPESVTQMLAWPVSLVLLAISVVATLFAGAVYLERVHGWDRVTARCASMPGALASVIVLAATSAADVPRVVLAQSIRIFILVALMPATLTLVGGRSNALGRLRLTPPTR